MRTHEVDASTSCLLTAIMDICKLVSAFKCVATALVNALVSEVFVLQVMVESVFEACERFIETLMQSLTEGFV